MYECAVQKSNCKNQCAFIIPHNHIYTLYSIHTYMNICTNDFEYVPCDFCLAIHIDRPIDTFSFTLTLPDLQIMIQIFCWSDATFASLLKLFASIKSCVCNKKKKHGCALVIFNSRCVLQKTLLSSTIAPPRC